MTNTAVSNMANDREKIDCFTCKHFYITWNKRYARGCKAMGFKSEQIPSQVVRQASGIECARYERKGIKEQ